MIRFRTLTALVAALPLSALCVQAQDPTRVSPGAYQVLLENERVRVLEMRLRVGEKDEFHSHPSEVVRFAGVGKARITLPDGAVVVKDIAAGEVMFHDAWTHRVENIGATEIVATIVELKAGK